MMNKNLFALALLAACGGKTDFVGGDDDGDDTGGAIVCDGLPKVTHEEFRDAQQGGVAVLLEAEVVADPQEGCEDKSLVGVWLYYKTQTDSDYRTPFSRRLRMDFSSLARSLAQRFRQARCSTTSRRWARAETPWTRRVRTRSSAKLIPSASLCKAAS